MTATARRPSRRKRPLLGLRETPGRLALAVMRLPRPLYRHHCGWVLGHVFVLIVHRGRKTGRRRETVAMVLAYDPETLEVVVCAGWAKTAWIRNLRAHPAVEIRIGRRSYVPEQRFLSQDESCVIVREFQRRHPRRTRLIASILGWGDLSSGTAIGEFVRGRPFVSFRPGPRAPR